MSSEALLVGAARRREVALETMHEINATEGVRHAASLAIVAIGQRLNRVERRSEVVATDAKLQPCVDCG